MGAKEFGDLSLRLADADNNAFSQAVQNLVFASRSEAASKMLTKRSLIQWEVPHLGSNQFIEMYINPQNLVFSSRKEINKVRTKGGYIAQYWGDDLDTINISGTTGDAAIEGINVLRDVYRSEQLALERIVSGRGAAGGEDKRRQSLMQLAAGVIMWYQGQGYRGYFTDMSYTESTNRLGLFDYTMNFTVVELLGERRRNFLPWHRHPWSTTLTPNTGPNRIDAMNQAIRGGGYAEGRKVGVLNIPVFDGPPGPVQVPISRNPDAGGGFRLETREVVSTSGNRGTVQVAILRADPKDRAGLPADTRSDSQFANDQIQGIINRGVPGTA